MARRLGSPVRLMHFADLHLDKRFPWAPPKGARSWRMSLRQTLLWTCRLADETGGDALTCGGDRYEQDRFTADTAEFLRSTFAELSTLGARLVMSVWRAATRTSRDGSSDLAPLAWSSSPTDRRPSPGRGSCHRPVIGFHGMPRVRPFHALSVVAPVAQSRRGKGKPDPTVPRASRLARWGLRPSCPRGTGIASGTSTPPIRPGESRPRTWLYLRPWSVLFVLAEGGGRGSCGHYRQVDSRWAPEAAVRPTTGRRAPSSCPVDRTRGRSDVISIFDIYEDGCAPIGDAHSTFGLDGTRTVDWAESDAPGRLAI